MSLLKSFLSGDDYICPVFVCQKSGQSSFKYVDVQQIQAESLVLSRRITGT